MSQDFLSCNIYFYFASVSGPITAADLSQKEAPAGFLFQPATIWDSSFLMTSAANCNGKTTGLNGRKSLKRYAIFLLFTNDKATGFKGLGI